MKPAHSRTRQLSCGDYQVTASPVRSSRRLVALFLALLTAGAYAAWQASHATPEARLQSEVAGLREQNGALQQELEQLRLSVGHAEATRKELQSQLDERATQVKKLQDEIGFLRSQRGAAAAASGPAPAR